MAKTIDLLVGVLVSGVLYECTLSGIPTWSVVTG